MSDANRIGRLHMPQGTGPFLMTRMTAVERLSEPFTIVVDVTYSGATPPNLHPYLSKMVGVEFDGPDYLSRWFHGILWEYVELGPTDHDEEFAYRLTLRPALLLWTQDRMHKIHSNKTVNDLINILPANAWKNVDKIDKSYEVVEYRVQYAESTFDFLSRSLEKEGIYYYYEHEEDKHTIVFVDAANNHVAMDPPSVLFESGKNKVIDVGVISSLVERRSFSPTHYTTLDYDYTAPTVSLMKEKKVETLGAPPPRFNSPTDINNHVGNWEEYPAGYDNATSAAGTRYATRWLERERRRMARSFAEGTLFAATVGKTLSIDLTYAAAQTTDVEYLIIATTHRYTAPGQRSGGGKETFSVELELMPAKAQYRPARATPIPRIYGPQTAIVIGPKGEEIYTDNYGRVKVQFFWGADATEPESLWCRVGQSGAGAGFGAFMIPRIGHEVIVEFLDGDPDRPIITGAVYNGSNLPDPSFGTSADNTVQGIRTNSSKGGGGYNEIKINDKKDGELFSFHAQKDLKWVVDKGDETRDLLEGSRTTVIHKGDETMTVTKGKRTTTIKGDEATTIQSGDVTHEVTEGDVTRTIKAGKRTTTIMGNDTMTIKTGDRDTKINTGNDSLTVQVGNVEIKVNVGSHKTTALSSIELTCGASSFKMDPMSIEMKSLNVTIEGSLMLQTKGLMVQQEASAIHIVKGAIVMIN